MFARVADGDAAATLLRFTPFARRHACLYFIANIFMPLLMLPLLYF